MFEKDFLVPQLPFDEKAYKSKRKLKIGYILNDAYFPVSEANQRAVKEVNLS